MNSDLEKFDNLILMLREIDVDKNTRKDLRFVLDFIADRLEEIKEKISND